MILKSVSECRVAMKVRHSMPVGFGCGDGEITAVTGGDVSVYYPALDTTGVYDDAWFKHAHSKMELVE